MDSRFIDVRVNGDSMWPTFVDGDVVRFEKILPDNFRKGQIVLVEHPFRNDFYLIKRISSVNGDKIFLVGDNPDPNASEDSHNFGLVKSSKVLAMLIEENS